MPTEGVAHQLQCLPEVFVILLLLPGCHNTLAELAECSDMMRAVTRHWWLRAWTWPNTASLHRSLTLMTRVLLGRLSLAC